ncbi:MAG TPA: type II secretion system F family protein, partial [Lachnospiraceae bacterium]|nr:type II secretion system F family protein [Lachnospiraceae bacterium]
MPGYQYRAIGPDGRERKGNVTAATKEQAYSKLKADGLIVVGLAEESLLTKDIDINIGGSVKARDYSVFCRQFVSIITAGVSVMNALQMLSEQTENKT